MLTLNRSLLNRENNVMNVMKALTSIFCMCNLLVILLSKITPRYFTLFTNGMFRPFNVRRESDFALVRKVDHLSLILIELNIPSFTPSRHGI
jgi:hypothetical protein